MKYMYVYPSITTPNPPHRTFFPASERSMDASIPNFSANKHQIPDPMLTFAQQPL